jgi:hypothetical protein
LLATPYLLGRASPGKKDQITDYENFPFGAGSQASDGTSEKTRLRRVAAASGRKFGLAVLSNQNVRVDGGYDVFGETPKTSRETRALPISNCTVMA